MLRLRLAALAAAAILVPGCDKGDTILVQQQTLSDLPAPGTGDGTLGLGFGGGVIPGVLTLADRNVDGTNELFAGDLAGTTLVNLSGPLTVGGKVWEFKWSPDRQWAAFLADKDIQSRIELYVVPATGGTPVNVSQLSFGEDVTEFTWSPAGNRVAYVAAGKLRVFAVGGTSSTALSTGGFVASNSYFWSPDSTRIAYVANQDTPDKRELYVVPAAGGAPVKVSGTIVSGGNVDSKLIGFVPRASWAPDGSRIAFQADANTDTFFELFTVTPTGTGRVSISGQAADSSSGPAAYDWTPDSSRLAYMFAADTVSPFEVHTALAAGGGDVTVSGTMTLFGTAIETYLAVSPAGDRVAYAAFQDSDSILEVYSSLITGGGNVKMNGTLTSGGFLEIVSTSPTWAPDGTRLAYLASQDTATVVELYTTAADGTGNTKISQLPATDRNVSSFKWSPLSSRVAYVADQDTLGRGEVYTAPAATAASSIKISGSFPPVTTGPKYAWATDGLHVLFQGRPDVLVSRYDVYAAPPLGATPPTRASGPSIEEASVAEFAPR